MYPHFCEATGPSPIFLLHCPEYSLTILFDRVFTDDVDLAGQQRGSGKAYENFGIPAEGVVVIVRPDGYVGALFPFDAMQDARAYFAGFMRTQNAQLGGVI